MKPFVSSRTWVWLVMLAFLLPFDAAAVKYVGLGEAIKTFVKDAKVAIE